jgi:hypothetical protein
MNKRLLSALCAFVMAFGSAAALPEEFSQLSSTLTVSAEELDDYSYRYLDDGTVEIYGYFGSAPVATIPSQIDGKPVTSISSYAFNENKYVKKVIIPEGVTNISEYAFKFCDNLETVILPDSLETIADNAFVGCDSMKDIVLPEGLVSIGESAFRECSNLKSITIPAGLTEIGNYAFGACENLTEINFAGTKEKWESIKEGKNIFPSQVKEIKCTDGEASYTYNEEDEKPKKRF